MDKPIKKLNDREVRMADMTASEGSERVVEGRAIVFDTPTLLYEWESVKYYEIIARGALEGADLSDVPFKYNHSEHTMVMARTRNKTLELKISDAGLDIRAELADTTAGNDLHKLVKRRDIDKMSFMFSVRESSYDNETHTRTITKIKKLWDVSAVDTPAYQDTYISARSFFEAEAEKERMAAEAAGLAKQRLALRCKLIQIQED